MTPKRVVALLLAALLVYFAFIGYRGILLLEENRWSLKILGLAVLVVPVIGLYAVVGELRFGRATERLGARLAAEGDPGEPDLPRRPSGRVERAAADALFEQRRVAVEADPDDWRGWYRLAVAYDLAGDRKRARAAMRTAISKAD